MKTRICILAVSAVAAMSTSVAGAMIPADSMSGYSGATRHTEVIRSTGHKVTKKQTAKYNKQAYVPGGSSTRVAKAIQSQGFRALP